MAKVPSKAKVLVTGATGFIGQNLVRMLLARGDEVTCLRRKTSSVDHFQSLDVRLVEGDVTLPETLAAAVAGMDEVFHLAGLVTALHRDDFFRVNEGGTRNVMQACAVAGTPPVVVLVSSLAAGGPQIGTEIRKEEDPPAPVSHYGKSKRAAEFAATEFAGRVPLTIVRPPMVFGGGDRAMLQIFKPIARLGVHLVPGYRARTFSLLHVDDLCQGLLLASQRGQRVSSEVESAKSCRGCYYLAHDEQPTYAELGKMIGQALGRRRTLCIPTAIWFMRLVALTNEGIGRLRGRAPALNLDKACEAAAGSWTCSPQRAKRELGWSCAADLITRLKETVNWYREQRWL
jgi:dihydroflavonol-4-reductase